MRFVVALLLGVLLAGSSRADPPVPDDVSVPVPPAATPPAAEPPVVAPTASPPAADAAAEAGVVVEEAASLPVEIAGRRYMLDAMVVRRPGTERLPVALITHGSALGDPHTATVNDWLRPWAHEMAHRGWLAVAVMRRGYGRSEGVAADDTGTCEAPDIGRYLDASADDLQAALVSITQRPDADMSRVIIVGDSAGGAAALDVAARNKPPLVAVINVAGGLARTVSPFHPVSECGLFASDLVWNFARFGSTTTAPTLWVYAENDSLFRPGEVGRLKAAYTGAGGKAELVMLPPFRGDGHTMFFAIGGRQHILPELDRFLRAHQLPTWDPAPFAPLLARLTNANWRGVKDYLSVAPTEKALAIGPGGRSFWYYGSPTLERAREQVLKFCREQVGADCRLAADNYAVLPDAELPKKDGD